ncbi:unnamed protein product [Acanthosepion pharaonis]|uniref:Uncharacterized protein n=1 Tax=Acanthosepion pharaonis TaxID=158019 RepID=A0A812E1S4_ACAPH|nr:unnamed protein product [Sepia pharaonis]
MRENTTEEERKWRQILEEKERFPLSDDDDDEEVVSDVQMLGAEFSGRLHESFTPVEEGHFVVTFPEWCQRSLNQLQKEIVDFKTRHRMDLELESEFRLQDSNLRWIESIAASNEDVHVFVVDWADKSIKEFAETGEIVGQCPLRDEGFLPWDICCLSKDNFVITAEKTARNAAKAAATSIRRSQESIAEKTARHAADAAATSAARASETSVQKRTRRQHDAISTSADEL